MHGDTTTTMAASLAAYYTQTPVGHVEAGLRTHTMYSPWPEEINRQITSRISALNFAPERPEAITEGTARLVGTDSDKIVSEVLRLLNSDEEYQAMAHARVMRALPRSKKLAQLKKILHSLHPQPVQSIRRGT